MEKSNGFSKMERNSMKIINLITRVIRSIWYGKWQEKNNQTLL